MNISDLKQKEVDALELNNLDVSSVFFTGYASTGEDYFLLIRFIFDAEDQDAIVPPQLIEALKSGKQTVDALPSKYIMSTEIFSFDFEKQEFTPNPSAITTINSATVPLHEDKEAFYQALEAQNALQKTKQAEPTPLSQPIPFQ